ncbi:MAG TPA: sigma-70 family RNA polymerase sigma factor [Polyangiaceae bacterium]|nr:sigma-70 family RNA polymerase sigma factor [Polyangiaceae bacterium]
MARRRTPEPRGTDRVRPESDPADSFESHALVTLRPVVDGALRRVIGGNDPDYEDVLQSALEHLLEAIRHGSFRGEGTLTGWALAIARNVAIDRVRARCRERRVFAREGDAEVLALRLVASGPDGPTHARQQLARFMSALSRVGPEKAEVVYLFDVLGHDLAEVAASAGISIAAAQSRLVRGRQEIAAHMARGQKNRGSADEEDDEPTSTRPRRVREG